MKKQTMRKETRAMRIVGLTDDYMELHWAGKAPKPEEFVKQHPDIAEELLEQIQATIWFTDGLNVRPKPLPPEVRKRIQHATLRPVLLRAAEKLHAHAQEVSKAESAPISRRSDLMVLLLYVAGATNQIADSVRGMVRLMKLVFLAQKHPSAARLLPLQYDFQPHKYGPLATGVYDDLQVLIWSELVKRTEFDEDGMPVTHMWENGEPPDTNFSARNAVYELSPEGLDYAVRLYRKLETSEPELLASMFQLKALLARMSWQQAVMMIYEMYPEYRVESDVAREQKEKAEDEAGL
jgi:hypothetical protein